MSRTTTIKRTPKSKRSKAAKLDAYGMSKENWARLRSKTNAEVLADARSDPDALPMEDRKPGRLARRVSRAKFIRWHLGMSQDQFAATFSIPLGTLRDWEQHRREPDQAARAYLEVIARAPKIVRKALAELQAQSRELVPAK